MSYSPVQSDDVHVGRDANDTTWLVVRYRDDWARAVLDGVYFDPLASRLELAVQLSSSHHDEPICAARVPLSASAPSASAVPQTVTLSQIWLPLAPVTDESGDQYRSDPVADVVLRRRACGGDFTPLPCFGGHGWETGRLDHPIGLALDARGLLYVADACNHRVQVVRPADGSVVIVLGRVDGYGRPVVGVDHGAMTEPVDVAVDACRCRIYVADRLGGVIHVYDQRFAWVRSFAPRPDAGWPAGAKPMPVGVAVDTDGTLLIADAHWPRLLHASADGSVRAEVPLRSTSNQHFAGLLLAQRFFAEGEAIIGPLDSGQYDTAWHQVIVDAEVPPGTSIEVQTYASNAANALGQFTRVIPTIATFSNEAGDPSSVGPAAGASSVVVNADAILQVRVGDTLEVDVVPAAALPDRVTVTAVSSPKVGAIVQGDHVLYGVGAAVRLVERGALRFPGGARVVHVLAAGEVADFSTPGADGSLVTVLPHAVAALFRAGDLIAFSDGAHMTQLRIASVVYAASNVAFTPSLTRDAKASTLRLVVAPGRLIVDGLTNYRLPAELDEAVIVAAEIATGVQTVPYLAEYDTGALWVDPAPLAGGFVTFENWTRFVTATHTPWAPPRPVPIDGSNDDASATTDFPEDGAFRRLVLSDTERWERSAHGPYRRDRPILVTYTGDSSSPSSVGPAPNATTMVLPTSAMPRVRGRDTVRLADLSRPANTQDVTLGLLPAPSVTVFVEGGPTPPLPTYGAGATLRLIQRDGRPLPGSPRLLYSLGVAEAVDLSGAPVDGTAASIAFPHNVAAFFRPGDVVAMAGGGSTTTLSVSSIMWAPAVTLTPQGDLVRYGSGTTVVVRERGGGPLPSPIPLYTLGPGEGVDFTAATAGVAATVAFPFAAAAVFRPGDVIDMANVLHKTTVSVTSIDLAASVVSLATPANASFVKGAVSLREAPGRLIAADLVGFEDPPPLDEMVRVSDRQVPPATGTGAADAAMLLAEPDVAALWVDPTALAGSITFATWESFAAPPADATDRGQYLWVRLRLVGRKQNPGDAFAVESPDVVALRLSFARPSLLKLLPATFSRRDEERDPAGAIFLERYLALFEGRLTRAESRYESLSRLLNPTAAPSDWLDWLASWLDLVFDPSWSVEKRRALTLRAVDLYRRRGTPESIRDWVEIYTGNRPELLEGFRSRVERGSILDRNAALGCTLLADESCAQCAIQAPNTTAHQFSLYVSLDDPCSREVVEPAVRAIVEAIKPSHTTFDLRMVLPEARVGIQSTVGVDLSLGDSAVPPPSVLGLGVPPTTGGRFRPIVGLDLFLENDPSVRRTDASSLGSDVSVETNLTLK